MRRSRGSRPSAPTQLLDVGAMSQQEHDQAQTLLRTAEAQLKAVDEQIQQQQNEWSATPA